jgi:peptidoglycan/LPS O-acetylase OafA/YrhL
MFGLTDCPVLILAPLSAAMVYVAILKGYVSQVTRRAKVRWLILALVVLAVLNAGSILNSSCRASPDTICRTMPAAVWVLSIGLGATALIYFIRATAPLSMQARMAHALGIAAFCVASIPYSKWALGLP